MGLVLLYSIIAFFSFKLIPEPRPISEFDKRREYYLYFFEFICLFFSIFAIIFTFFSFFADFFSSKQVLSIPLTHFLCDSVLFLILQPKFAARPQELKENRKKSGFIEKFKRFLDDPLQIIHHILLILIYLKGINEKEDFFYIIFVFLDEISVPWLLIKNQMKRLNYQEKILYELIEYFFIGFYVGSRGVLLPVLGVHWSLFSKNKDFLGFLLISMMNWINFFWVMQTLCLFYKKSQWKMLKFLEDYRKNGVFKMKIHGFMAVLLVFIPNCIFYLKL